MGRTFPKSQNSLQFIEQLFVLGFCGFENQLIGFGVAVLEMRALGQVLIG